MLVIRFQRTGRKNVPAYRLVLTEKTSPPKGRVQEYLGHYLPSRHPRVFECKKDRIEHWVKHGAQVSDTAARLLKNAGVDGLETFITSYTKKKKRKEQTTQQGVVTPPTASLSEDDTEKKEE
jgi:small subunit ribosomal protein S16